MDQKSINKLFQEYLAFHTNGNFLPEIPILVLFNIFKRWEAPAAQGLNAVSYSQKLERLKMFTDHT